MLGSALVHACLADVASLTSASFSCAVSIEAQPAASSPAASAIIVARSVGFIGLSLRNVVQPVPASHPAFSVSRLPQPRVYGATERASDAGGQSHSARAIQSLASIHSSR